MKRLSRVVQSLVILREVFLVGRRLWIECTPSLLQSRDIVQDGLSLCGPLFVLSRATVRLLILNTLDCRLVPSSLREPFEQILCECHLCRSDSARAIGRCTERCGCFLE